VFRRRAHYIKTNERSETIHNCIFYDCESTQTIDAEGAREHHLLFGWAARTRRTPDGSWSEPDWIRFTKHRQFWKWVTDHTHAGQCQYVWAHNESFDFCVSDGMAQLRKLSWKLLDAIVDEPPFILRYRQDKRKLVIVDTLNIWRMSLRKMGKMVGLEKYEMPKVFGNREVDDTYCRRDVEIIYRAVTEWATFLRDEDMGKFCLTVASQSMQTFRHRYLQDRILVDSDDRALEIARKAYHGGRVEAFYIGSLKGDYYMVDVNSLYPYVMRTYGFPIRLRTVIDKPSNHDTAQIIQKYLACAHVTVCISEPTIAFVNEHKLLFPIGTFEAYVSTPELECLLQRDELLNVHRLAVYEKGFPFVQFVDELYAKRVDATKRGLTVESEHYKLLLNSFSGKWGQNGIKWVTVARGKQNEIRFWPEINAQTLQITRYRQFGGLIQRREMSPESNQSCPAIAAHITSYGRMVLWTLMRKVTSQHYFYCDTDALLVDSQGLEAVRDLIDDTKLGCLKIAGHYNDVVVNGCKDYVLDGKRTLKGVRESAETSDGVTYHQEQWASFTGQLRRGAIDCPITSRITRTQHRRYIKGTVTTTGCVLPFHLPDDLSRLGGTR